MSLLNSRWCSIPFAFMLLIQTSPSCHAEADSSNLQEMQKKTDRSKLLCSCKPFYVVSDFFVCISSQAKILSPELASWIPPNNVQGNSHFSFPLLFLIFWWNSFMCPIASFAKGERSYYESTMAANGPLNMQTLDIVISQKISTFW